MNTPMSNSTIRCIFSPFERNILYEALVLYREKHGAALNQKVLSRDDAAFYVVSVSDKNRANFDLLVEDLGPTVAPQYRISFSQQDLDYIQAAVKYVIEERWDLLTSDEMVFALSHILEVSKQPISNMLEYSKV